MSDLTEKSFEKAREYYQQKKVTRLKVTLIIVLCALFITLVAEVYFSPLDLVDGAIATCFLVALFLYFWVDSDTASTVVALTIWSIAILISFLAWHNNGLFDSPLFALPCLVMLSIVLASRSLSIPIFFYVQALILLLMFAHVYGFIDTLVPEDQSVYIRAFDMSMITTFFAITTFFYVNDMKFSLRQYNRRYKRLKHKLKNANKLVNYDQLTLLPNERICTQDTLQLVKEAKEKKHILAYITLDIHNLRTINNSMGHDIGALLLKQIADRLSAIAKEDARLYLLQGNEFVVLKVSNTHERITTFKEQILQATSQPFLIGGYELEVFFSIGISVAPFDGETMETLEKKAHMAMAQASNKNINTALFYDESMSSNEDNKYQLIKDLREAIHQGEFTLSFQPKVDLKNNRIVGAEALIRWHSEKHGFVLPDVFIPVAEESGLIVEITKWVLNEACAACANWHELGFTDLNVAVNLSLVDFRRGNLPQIVMVTLQNNRLAPKYLELEITESVMTDDVSHIQDQIHQLHRHGITFAIDDFGTGYSNLGYLTQFNVSTLKIDQSFVRHIIDSDHNFIIVKAIMNMSKSLGMYNVAEGIETQEIADKLAGENCQFGQGYLWSKPVKNDEFIKLVSLESKDAALEA